MEIEGDTERHKRRMLALGIIIGLVIIISIVWFFWGSLINQGTINLIGEAPFSVETVDGQKFFCPTSPCKIKQKMGLKDFLIKKDGYQEILTTAKVKLWRSVDLNLSFSVIPHIETSQNFPELEQELRYKIVKDESNGLQKLVLASDKFQNAIVYFPGNLENPEIIGNVKSIIVISQGAVYLIDAQKAEKEKLASKNFNNLKSAKWAKNGRYLVFERENSDSLWIFDIKRKLFEQLALKTPLTAVNWDDDSYLIFATEQGYQGDFTELQLLPEKSPGNFTFGSYDAEKRTYKRFVTYSEIKELPTNLMALNNGKYIYFKSSKENFRIILR